MVIGGDRIDETTQLGSRTIRHKEIGAAITVPINPGRRPGIVRDIQSRDGRHRTKALLGEIEKRAVALVPANRAAIANQRIETLEVPSIAGTDVLDVLSGV